MSATSALSDHHAAHPQLIQSDTHAPFEALDDLVDSSRSALKHSKKNVVKRLGPRGIFSPPFSFNDLFETKEGDGIAAFVSNSGVKTQSPVTSTVLARLSTTDIERTKRLAP